MSLWIGAGSTGCDEATRLKTGIFANTSHQPIFSLEALEISQKSEEEWGKKEKEDLEGLSSSV